MRIIVSLLMIGVALLLFGSYWGLVKAPAETYQGQVQRIMYIHVPTAWTALIVLTFSFIAAIAYLVTEKWKWDHRAGAATQLGVLLAFLLCIQGAIWAKPTWGVWWDWDPRLTTSAILCFAFAAILALRNYVDDPVKRATWSAVAVIIAYVDVPILYFSVRWWNSLHQQQSTIQSVAPAFRTPLLINAIGMLLLGIGLIMLRSRLAAAELQRELAPPLQEQLAPAQPRLQAQGGLS